MRFELLPINQVDASLSNQWSLLQGGSPALASPFFSFGFARIVGECCADTFVGLVKNDSKVSGILPFHIKSRGAAVPLAGQYSDYQGFIGKPPDLEYIPEMLRAFRVSAYDFNHAIEDQEAFLFNAFWRNRSPRVDLRNGYDEWKQQISAKSSVMKSLARKERKIAREVGPLRFVEHDTSASSWQEFKGWKDRALRSLGQPGFPGLPWASNLIETLQNADDGAFNGCFSTLYAGDKLVAAHFGIRSNKVWHWWFPSYDFEFSAYSPGLLMLNRCIEAADRLGFSELDFGRGDERYKKEFANESRAICEGSFERMTLVGATRGVRKTMQRLANRFLRDHSADLLRRGTTKILRAGLL